MSRGPDREAERIATREDTRGDGRHPVRGLERPEQDLPDLDRKVRHPRRELGDERVPDRERPNGLSAGAREILFDVGRFRTVSVDDLVRFRDSKPSENRQNLNALVERGLARKRSVWFNKRIGRLDVVVLSKAGKRLLEKDLPKPEQRVYSGFVKPAEVPHDAAIYRMFYKEKGVIESSGGKIRRVVLDYELKRNVYAPLAKIRGKVPPEEYARKQAEVAQANHLKVVDGKIPLPDLRIEYETEQGDLARVNLELATHHYHGSQLAQKIQAGFKLYAPDGAGPRTTIYEGRETTTDILSL